VPKLSTESRTLSAFGETWPAAIGRAGAVPLAAKREGDGATPLGVFAVEAVLLRPDRVPLPPLALPWRWLRPADGWGDDPGDPAYNRPVRHPHRHGAERLWREDGAYDIILVLAHNRAPIVPGAGSAIFWHLAHPDFRATEGCVAIARDAMLAILPKLTRSSTLEIARA
jgi:L,D-peptidoglycan transpeptidase YkuD (ErfK/YbiS/YcfS/YnhG family)